MINSNGVNGIYKEVMKPDFDVVVKRKPSVCSQKIVTNSSPRKMPVEHGAACKRLAPNQ